MDEGADSPHHGRRGIMSKSIATDSHAGGPDIQRLADHTEHLAFIRQFFATGNHHRDGTTGHHRGKCFLGTRIIHLHNVGAHVPRQPARRA